MGRGGPRRVQSLAHGDVRAPPLSQGPRDPREPRPRGPERGCVPVQRPRGTGDSVDPDHDGPGGGGRPHAPPELLDIARAPFVVLGHTHLPMRRAFGPGLLVNPGSVGQPRDGDPRAAWGLLDTARRSFEVRRVPYDVDGVARTI